ncbi:hypothetical protein B0H13DRAFT_1862075 [Mycena leptocephala]|nr:hypothetical protein B0H13DRAFT_1862075 [Mycena leptocephala]
MSIRKATFSVALVLVFGALVKNFQPCTSVEDAEKKAGDGQQALIGNCEYCSDENFRRTSRCNSLVFLVYLGDTGGLAGGSRSIFSTPRFHALDLPFVHIQHLVPLTCHIAVPARWKLPFWHPKALTPDFLPYPTADEVAAANQFGETFALWSIGSYRACVWYGGDVSLGYFGEMNPLREVLRRHARPTNIFNYKEPEYEIYAFEWS